ncbi:polar amino acid ABC transporter, inner membrane subunit [Thermaerobacter marianensis DSM 12885]|uniref:Polar amino acid ABC transporter, inner membrane subunit n=1 Tax=Thermaerobacter marianensis (strain ATCC 700841 / DSM 12885 / JCM 10246 / 7p75a) TaxID=644966 RepID=E6SMQ7_THEM7|nr:polar amino acid ABC transporter, inner membrane subunit [Thermaerobacter marianensis DSM 12885]
MPAPVRAPAVPAAEGVPAGPGGPPLATPPPQVPWPQRAAAWIRANLLGTWYHGLLTLVCLTVLVRAGRAVVEWAFTRAQWAVVRDNLLLLLVGAYPRDQLWRVGAALGVLVLLVLAGGLAWAGSARWRRFQLPVVAAWVVLVPAAMALVLSVPRVGGAGTGYGLVLTLVLAVAGITLSFPLGVALALGRVSSLPVVRALSIAYIELVRGTPLMVVLFFSMTALPLFLPPAVRPDLVTRAAAGLVLFTAAYVAEAVRGGLQGVPRGQIEAAQALGLTGTQAVFLVVLPQALRAVIPALVGQFISLFKDTSLVAVWGLLEFVGVAQSVLSNPAYLGRHVEVYAFVAAVYWVFCYGMSLASRRLERRLGVGER